MSCFYLLMSLIRRFSHACILRCCVHVDMLSALAVLLSRDISLSNPPVSMVFWLSYLQFDPVIDCEM